ncbi:hypothetical protein [Streptomyces sp. NPDC020983]|uniref:hypothetical protein n=1 Tax=Streptomyces sp. NPDC020983 TaxID=3365106 RepID=UPI003789B17A
MPVRMLLVAGPFDSRAHRMRAERRDRGLRAALVPRGHDDPVPAVTGARPPGPGAAVAVRPGTGTPPGGTRVAGVPAAGLPPRMR